mmetsp:Transcript_31439/g.82237  ORF Transcript_31439/g.82237 Transcript_31439/m.82237 type:complete len:216 (-) Transcript_31439:8-655(-)
MYCAISSEKLREPVVCSHVGDLFNKEELLQYLLGGGGKNEALAYLKSLKDVFELRGEKVEGDTLVYACPLTQLETTGLHKFVALPTCGHLLSQRGYREIEESGKCPVCSSDFNKAETVIVNGTEEERSKQLSKWKEVQAERAAKKKEKKSKRKAEDESNGSSKVAKAKTGRSLTEAAALASSSSSTPQVVVKRDKVLESLFAKKESEKRGNVMRF